MGNPLEHWSFFGAFGSTVQVLWPLIQLQRDMRHFHFHDSLHAHGLSVKSSMFAQVHALDSQRGRFS